MLREIALVHTCYYQAIETVRLIAGLPAYHEQFGAKNENNVLAVKTNNLIDGRITLKKSHLLGAVCACLTSFVFSA